MYIALQNRHSTVLAECIRLLEQFTIMAPPATRAKTPTASSASSPSLRSKTPVNVPLTPSSLNPGGNVKVVVRVRGFLPRGEAPVFTTQLSQ